MKKVSLWGIAIVSIIMLTSFTTDYFKITKYLDIFVNVYKNLNTFYVDEVDPEHLVTVGIDAMLQELDPYSDFIPAEEIERFDFQTTGEYGGIGATIQKVGDFISVVSPYEGSPADKVGLQSGDKFLKVDGVTGKGKSSEEIVKLLKGEPGTTVNVVIGRGDQEFERTITREIIKVKNVTFSGIVDEDIAYIKLSTFTTDAGKEVADALTALKEQTPISGIVLDLKGNGGGLLSEAISVTNVFIPKGETVVTIKTRDDQRNKSYKTTRTAVDTTTPLVVLIDGGTASASEIVSGTIQDLDRGVVVGRNSFGKGLVQSTRDLSYDTRLKLTTAKYLIPSGRSVQRLNYAEKDENGKAIALPDSLRTAYTTKNGRTVFDGSGVMPDIEIKTDAFPQIAFTLFAKNYIYDYSLQYKETNSSIPDADQFELSDEEYEQFKLFLADKDYSYQTKSEKELEEFKAAAAEEKHDAAFENALNLLEANLQASKEDDLDKYKPEIKYLLEREIASRYYYSSGRILNGLDNDDELQKAIEVINNLTTYQELLTP